MSKYHICKPEFGGWVRGYQIHEAESRPPRQTRLIRNALVSASRSVRVDDTTALRQCNVVAVVGMSIGQNAERIFGRNAQK